MCITGTVREFREGEQWEEPVQVDADAGRTLRHDHRRLRAAGDLPTDRPRCLRYHLLHSLGSPPHHPMHMGLLEVNAFFLEGHY